MSDRPQRLQLSRRKGYRKPEGAVVVSRPSRFGNPFTIADALEAEWADTVEKARAVAVRFFGYWLGDTLYGGPGPEGTPWSASARDRILADLPTLRGKDLLCWCPLPAPGEPDWCHGAVLLRLSNPEVAL